MRSVKALLAGLAGGITSFVLSALVTIIIAELRAVPKTQLERGNGGLSFQVAFLDINLLPAFVVALLMFVMAFTWMLRRREARH